MAASKIRSDLWPHLRHHGRRPSRRAREAPDRGGPVEARRPAAAGARAGPEDRREPPLAALGPAVAAGDGGRPGASGAGTFIADGPPRLGEAPLRFLAALHGFTRDKMFEARRVLEVGTAGLAAERANGEQMAAMAEEVASMFATLDQPLEFLRHDVQFHRAVAAGSLNPVLATLIDTVSELVYETRRSTVERATDLKESARR